MWLLVLVALGLILADAGVWTFWGFKWWTVLITYFAIVAVGSGHCKDCLKLAKKK